MSFSVKKSQRVQIDFKDDEGLTEQHHKDSCDMHIIMNQAQKQGVLTHVNQYKGQYGNFLNIGDLQQNMNKMIAAQEMFDTVPAKIRKKFGNDPEAFVDFMTDETNREAIQKMGFDTSHLPPAKETQQSSSEVQPSEEKPV